MSRIIQLEPEAAAVSDANSVCPLIFQLPPEKGREVLEQAQSTPVCMYPAQIDRIAVNTGCWGRIPVYVVRPETAMQTGNAVRPGAVMQTGNAVRPGTSGLSVCLKEKTCGQSNVIFYIHGAGWVFGSFHTHEKLVRELAARTGCTVIFPEYSRAPEARYPAAIEQCYSVLCMLPEIVARFGCEMNPHTLTVAGDSAGGNMAIAMTLMAKYRKGPCIQKQLLYYPVTDACFCTESYCKFAECYYLYRDGMIWFWDQYAPSPRERKQITASPLRASGEQLCGLPEAMILNGEADVLRDEGEAYVRKLRDACVPVTAIRFQAMIHDFVMLNALDQTQACRAAMDVSTAWINRKNCEAQ